jgi:Skp family chaperone for outer membrane proteins
MPTINRFGLIAILVASFAIAAAAQVAPRSVLINTAAFYDEKAGITKLTAAAKQLDSEFAKDVKDLQDGSAKLAIIAEELNKPLTDANRSAMIAKKEEGETLQRKLEYDKARIERELSKRREVLLGPITFDIGKAIAEFGKKNNYGSIFDASKLAETGVLLFVGDATDITKDFIAFYNARIATVPIK